MKNLEQFQRFGKGKKTENSSSKNVWGYTRVSSKDQFANRSLKNQDISIIECAKEYNWYLTKTFGGTYESASDDFTRKEFKRLIDEVKRARKRPYSILIFKVSRFSRTGGNGIALANELIEELGVHLFEISTGKNTFTEHGKLDIYNSLIEARRETVNKLEITIPGMKSFLQAGNWLGHVPKGWDHYGPRVTDRTKAANEQKIILNNWGKKLQKAWKWKDSGMTDVEIRKKLSLGGVNVTKQYLSAMWRNPFYCGILSNNLLEGEIVRGNWEPMIDKATFLRIQTQFEKEKYEVKKQNTAFPLSSHIKCGKCGRNLVGYTVKKKDKTGLLLRSIDYYKCNYCRGMNINVDTTPKAQRIGAHELFENYLDNFKLDSKYFEIFKDSIKISCAALNQEKINEKAILSREISVLKEKEKTLKKRFAFGEFDDKELYNELAKELREKIIPIESKISAANSTLSNHEILTKKALEIFQNIRIHWKNADYSLKHLIQKMIFPEGVLLHEKKDHYLTNKVNLVFEVILRVSGNYTHKKSGLSKLCFEKSASVAGARLELATFGL